MNIMGRGNICVYGKFDGLYFLDKDLLDVYNKVDRCECGSVKGFDYETEPKTARELSDAGIEYDYDGTNSEWAFDQFSTSDNWNEMINIMQEYFISLFKSFTKSNKWRGTTAYSSTRNCHVVLESELFDIAIADNEWSVAWLLLERDDIDDNKRPLMKRHYKTYLEALKNALVDFYGEATEYGGAWTSGETHKKVA